MLLLYALHQRDPVFILGQAGGLVIYLRNLMLIYKKTPLSTRAKQSAEVNTEKDIILCFVVLLSSFCFSRIL